ncbi:hypothetical protein GGI12_001857 [Dipsacomyces acuminosporus]|nr:hypothetical protein GGI12_001857 [Dipsacomyces acuminosporus]
MSGNDRHVVCLEFFSGIGGLHYGFQESGVDGEVAMSFDMNENANKVYKHNFKTQPNNKAIDYLAAQDIERYNANCWLLSPPCQPYTRGGKYLDDEDPRAKGLIHLLKLLPTLKNIPSYFFLENVMNFENSRSRKMAVETLGHLGFEIHECLISPVQMGIPNNRLRYFLIARRKWPDPKSGSDSTEEAEQDKQHNRWLAENEKRTKEYLDQGRDAVQMEWPFGPAVESLAGGKIPKIPLAEYIDASLDDDKTLWVPEKIIMKRKNLEFDIVRPSDTQTSTFTKAYGSKHLIGSGSLLQTKRMDVVENGFGSSGEDQGNKGQDSRKRARLAKYTLEFPADVTQRQQLQLLGNSLNVKVVGELLKHVLFAHQCAKD